MKKILLFLAILILLNGCKLTPEKIAKNPELAVNDCNNLKDTNQKENCFNEYAKLVSSASKETSINLCNNLEGYSRNKCFFDVSNELEKANKLDDSIQVCKLIEKEGFSEWCESRRNKESISVAPPLI